MNENPYDTDHLQEYTGILTSNDARNERFKMELKVEDNPVMERWTQKNESSIELEFRYNFGPSPMFFHNIHACPCNSQIENCNDCERMRKIYDVFVSNLYALHFGDTFKIRAALINNDQSVLPAEIHSFENYQPLLAACTDRRLRLDDTPEGINKKYEREQQRLQREREAEEKRKVDEKKAQEDAKRKKRKESIQHLLGKSPNTNQIIVTVIGTTIANQIPNIVKFVKNIYRLFVLN